MNRIGKDMMGIFGETLVETGKGEVSKSINAEIMIRRYPIGRRI